MRLVLCGAKASSSHLFFRLVNLNICGCNFFQGHMYVQQKNMCFEFWARVDTKFLNLSHHVLSMDGWPGDATFSCWANLWRSSACIQPKKVQPLGFYFWHLRLGLFKSPFWLVKLNICGCRLSQGQMYVQQKTCVCILGARWHKCWICHIMSYLWMVGLVMRLFSCGANLWRPSACIQPQKVQPLGIYFWHLRLRLFKSPFLVETEHMWL